MTTKHPIAEAWEGSLLAKVGKLHGLETYFLSLLLAARSGRDFDRLNNLQPETRRLPNQFVIALREFWSSYKGDDMIEWVISRGAHKQGAEAWESFYLEDIGLFLVKGGNDVFGYGYWGEADLVCDFLALDRTFEVSDIHVGPVFADIYLRILRRGLTEPLAFQLKEYFKGKIAGVVYDRSRPVSPSSDWGWLAQAKNSVEIVVRLRWMTDELVEPDTLGLEKHVRQYRRNYVTPDREIVYRTSGTAGRERFNGMVNDGLRALGLEATFNCVR